MRALRRRPTLRAADLGRLYGDTNALAAEGLWRRFGGAEPAPRRAFEVAVSACGHLVGVAFERDATGEPEVVADAKRMSVLFLTDVLAAPGGAAAAGPGAPQRPV